MTVEEPDAQVASEPTTSQPNPPAQPGWVAPAALALAVIAIAVAIGGALWASTRTPDAPAVTAQQPDGTAQQPDGTALQPDAAKARACAAFDMVRKAVSVQTNINLGPDAVAKVAVAANARLAHLAAANIYFPAWTRQPQLTWRMRPACSRTNSRTSQCINSSARPTPMPSWPPCCLTHRQPARI